MYVRNSFLKEMEMRRAIKEKKDLEVLGQIIDCPFHIVTVDVDEEPEETLTNEELFNEFERIRNENLSRNPERKK